MRKLLGVGFSGFFMTEEAIRRALGDTVPRDWVEFVIDQSEHTRSELLDRMSAELGRAIENVDLSELLAEALEGRTIEIKTEIRLGRKETA